MGVYGGFLGWGHTWEHAPLPPDQPRGRQYIVAVSLITGTVKRTVGRHSGNVGVDRVGGCVQCSSSSSAGRVRRLRHGHIACTF